MGKRGVEYTPRKRASIVALHKQGLSVRKIEWLGYGKRSAINNIIKRFQTEGTTSPRKRSGRPRLSSIRSDRSLVRLSLLNKFKGSQELATDWFASTGVSSSASTVRSRLVSAGLKSYRPARKPLLTNFQRLRRLRFARNHATWSLQDWRKVAFYL